MIKSKKQMYLAIGIFAVLLMLTTVTYAFFNYTRTGIANRISVGRIYFNTSQNGNINLTNVFPIDASEATGENPNYDSIEITITGDTDYTGGIEYVVTATNVNLSVNGKQIPITLDINVDGLGTEETGDYYINRDNYSVSKYKLEYNDELDEESHILIGYIAPNTTSGTIEGIDGSISIKAYLDKAKIAIANTYDGDESDYNGTTNEWVAGRVVLTTNEWNSLQNSGLSFKIKVEANEGIWVPDQMILHSIIKRKAPKVSYIASYDDLIASNSNYSSYTTQDTVGVNDNKQTVYYYTGNDFENANVLFGGYCWQIVRTTDNGGVKLIYNGVAQKDYELTTESLNDSDITYTNDTTYPYTYNRNSKKWTSTNQTKYSTSTFKFNVKEAGEYAINYSVTTKGNTFSAKFYKNGTLLRTYISYAYPTDKTETDFIDLGTLTTSDEIKVEFVRGNAYFEIYNIVFDVGKVTNRVESDIPLCKTNREVKKSVNGTYGYPQLADNDGQAIVYAFGRSFDYDFTTGLFTIEDNEGLPSSWSSDDTNNNGIADNEDLIGAYTCLSNSNTCSELYYISNQYNAKFAYGIKYTIGDGIKYSVIGNTSYNVLYDSIAKVGYMFNKVVSKYSSYNNNFLEFFATATWDPINSEYVLSDGNGQTTPDDEHPYSYFCSTLLVGIRCAKEDKSKLVYKNIITIENGEMLEDVIYKMTGVGSAETKAKNADYQLNVHNSAIKGYIDSWYKKNLLTYTNYLDNEAVYCNDRTIISGWDPNTSTLNNDIRFYNYAENKNLNCQNGTDRFAVTNPKAKLTYPIGLLTESERGLSTVYNGSAYWLGSPYNYPDGKVREAGSSYSSNYSTVTNQSGVRPVITLKPGTRIESGTGTYTDPYIVGPVVEREYQ